MQTDPQPFLFLYSNGKKKTVLKALFFRKCLMVVGWAQGLGSFLCPQLGWCLGVSPSVMETTSEVLSNSQEPRSSWLQHLRVLQALPPRAKREKQTLHKVCWSAIPGKPSSLLYLRESLRNLALFLFLFGHTRGAFAQKPGSKMAFQPQLNLALVGRHQSIQEKVSQRFSGSQYTCKNICFQLLEWEFTSSSRKQRFDR